MDEIYGKNTKAKSGKKSRKRKKLLKKDKC